MTRNPDFSIFLDSRVRGNDVKKTLNFSLLTVVIAGVAQLVEHNLAKVGVAGSNPVARSIKINDLSSGHENENPHL